MGTAFCAACGRPVEAMQPSSRRAVLGEEGRPVLDESGQATYAVEHMVCPGDEEAS